MSTQGSLAIATAVTGSALALTLAAPMVHADPVVDDISNIIKNDRGKYGPGCPPLIYNAQLENIAQRGNNGVPVDASNYNGQATQFLGQGKDRATALTNAYERGAGAMLSRCDVTEFGASFTRHNVTGIPSSYDRVGITFGKPAAAPKPPDKKASDPVPEKKAPDPVPEKKAPDPVPQATPVTNAIALSFGAPSGIPGVLGGGRITATVNNSSDLPGSCSYTSAPFGLTDQNFSVGPHGTANLTFTGTRAGIRYHAVVSCNDASNKQTQPIGKAEQDVTF
jgi:hypothetical protein